MANRGAELRVTWRRSPWASVMPAFRYLVSISLIAALAIGIVRFTVLGVKQAGALDFSARMMSVETAAVGIQGIAAADIDDDGDIDVVTAGLDGIKLYEQQDNKVFEAKIIDDKDGERVQIIDLNGDGSLDLLVGLRSVEPSVRWYKNDGNREFTGTNIGTGTDGVAWAGDIDADGDPDIITSTTQGGLRRLERWMNNGSGSFTSTLLSSDSGVYAISVADVDGNGYPDIITGGEKSMRRWSTSDGYTWGAISIDDSNTGQRHLYVADVNKDGKEDIVAAEPANNLVTFYRNVDSMVFERIDLASNVDATTVVVVDLDEDGDEDVVVAAQDDNSVFWYSNDGSEEFTKRTIASGLQSVFGVAVSDLDNDNDFDIVAGDHMRGTVYWYERILAAPVASTPGNFAQSTDGNGIVTFDTTLSDADYDPARIRVQYSVDGVNWYKPWITQVSVSAGSVNLKNSDGYQIGSSNAIDTDDYGSVKVTVKWDTQLTRNTGGALWGEYDTVQIRVIPRDDSGNGTTVTSSKFTVDNRGPVVGSAQVSSVSDQQVTLAWDKISDASGVSFKVYYGTDAVEVVEKNAEVWDQDDDNTLSDNESIGTIVTGLTQGTLYTFKVFASDVFGNESSMLTLTAMMSAGAGASPLPSLLYGPTATPEVPSASPATYSVTPPPIAVHESPSVVVGPSVMPSLVGSENRPPFAEAGQDQVVNPGALVILDGTQSRDPEGMILSFEWRQIMGPRVVIDSADTVTPSFNANHENATYIFSLIVRDWQGLIATDTVTIATRPFPVSGEVEQGGVVANAGGKGRPKLVASLLWPLDLVLFVLAIVIRVTGIIARALGKLGGLREMITGVALVKLLRGGSEAEVEKPHRGRLVDFQTGKPIPAARIIIRAANGKVFEKLKTDSKGKFSTALPVGDFTIAVRATGYTFSPAASTFKSTPDEIIYTGGVLGVKVQSRVMNIVIPMKQTGEAPGKVKMNFLRLWQLGQRLGHKYSWSVLVSGSIVNTVLLIWVPELLFLSVEIGYIVLVGSKVFVDMRLRPSYGLVRDAITHIPLDLAVVRFYEGGMNKLIMTRVTNSQGKFFVLPEPGMYTISVTKRGYATFTKHGVKIIGQMDGVVQIKADLMPVAPQQIKVAAALAV